MVENIVLSFQGLWSHKFRSFLTMLGIIIGISSIITIVSTIKGTNEQIKENLIGAGNNVVTVQLTQDGYEVDLQYSSAPEGVAVITEETRAALDELESVEALLCIISALGWRMYIIRTVPLTENCMELMIIILL